jgi:D-proline reductase (dithiol) PrdB
MIPEFKAFQYQAVDFPRALPKGPLQSVRVSLLTSGGLYLKTDSDRLTQSASDESLCGGDPTYRVIPRNVDPDEIAVAHLHLNPDDVVSDFNIALPLEVSAQFENERRIGALAENHHSFTGYQGSSSTAWRDVYGPELATRLRQVGVDLLILAPG